MTLRDDERAMLRDVPDDDPRVILAQRLMNERAKMSRARALLGCGSEEPLLDAVRRTSGQLTEQMAEIATLREELRLTRRNLDAARDDHDAEAAKLQRERDEIGIQLDAAQKWIKGNPTWALVQRLDKALREVSIRVEHDGPCWCVPHRAGPHSTSCMQAREAARAANGGA